MFRIIKAKSSKDIDDAKLVRKTVFQQEQCIDNQEDFDGKDETALHYIVYDEQPIATARVRFPEDEKRAKVERVCVIPKYRSKGVGKQLMIFISNDLKSQNTKELYLDSQLHVKGFYEKLGYKQEGEPFDEVGIPHVKMVKVL